MAHYLIDFENLKNISGCATLLENDTIVFFYSKNANTLSFELHIELSECKANKEYIKAESGGKNALDFQLSTYVGYLIAKKPEEKICIISKDNGFQNVLSFWKQRGQDTIELRKNIIEVDDQIEDCTTEKSTENDEKAVKPEHEETIEIALKKNAKKLDITPEQQKKIIEIFNNFKTKPAINNNLSKYFRDSEKVGEINKVLKPFFKNKSK